MILFVGDKPSSRMKPDAEPFKGAGCESRLKEWIRVLGCYPYYIVNSIDPAGLELAAVFDAVGSPVIALGNAASKKLKRIQHFKLPHPSGRNRQINNETFISEKLEECKKYIESLKVSR